MNNSLETKEDHWIPLADLMTGMMMLFMLIAVLFMLRVQENVSESQKNTRIAEEARSEAEAARRELEASKKRVEGIAAAHENRKEILYERLKREFGTDLPQWKAALDPDLTIRFDDPQVMFDTNSSDLRPRFKAILDNFFPRYIAIVISDEFRNIVDEIKIEGHTSSSWNNSTNPDEAYFKNMELSQNRSRKTLEYIFSIPALKPDKMWLKGKMTANGLSFSRLRLNEDGKENTLASQRVEFRLRTNSDEKLSQILKELKQ